MNRIPPFLLLALLVAPAFGADDARRVVVEGRVDSAAVERECEAIIDSLVERYGPPRRWKTFPVRYSPRSGGAIAGYTAYSDPDVVEIVIYQSYEESRGGTLDHELTHAFFFYYLDSNFDLFLNEGIAQNSERGARRERLRVDLARRARAGTLLPLDALYGRDEYDPDLALYAQGFGVVDYLLARGGGKWFAAFLDELVNENRSIDDALRRFYGLESLDALEKAWLDYLRAGQNRAAVPAIN